MGLNFLPNGKEVVYAQFENGSDKGGIVKLNIETGDSEYLTQGGADFCPSSDIDASVKYHKIERGDRFGESFENAYSVDSKTKKVEQITTDTIGSAEECPTPSPDGELIAISTYVYASHGRYPSGIAVYPKNELKNFDPGRLPPLIKGGTPLFWSPDSKWLYFRNREDKVGGPMTFSLHRVFVETGRVEDLLITNTIGASIAPKGEWVISIHPGKGFYSIMAHNLFKKEAPRQLFVRDNYLFYDIAVQPKVFVPKRKLVGFSPGLTTEIVGEEVSLETSGLTDELQTELILEDGFERTDFIRFSPRG